MQNSLPLFQDKIRLLYKEYSHTTRNGNSVWTYIIERLERFDDHKNEYIKYSSYDTVRLTGYAINESAGDYITIKYTRKNKNSLDFKLLSTEYTK